MEQPAGLGSTANYWLDAQLARRLSRLPPRPSLLVVMTGMVKLARCLLPRCVFLDRHGVRAVAVDLHRPRPR